MRATDVMTHTVITVGPETLVQDLAKLLSDRGISGAPVVDANGKLVGIVSEGDLLHRSEIGTQRQQPRRTSWWLSHFASDTARDYIKAHGRTVGDIMTRDVASVTEETGLAEIATLLETRRIKRVPVVRDGRLVGIISRSNLVRALGTAANPPAPAVSDDDRTIRANLLAELRRQDWANRLWPQDILVNGGVVHLWFSSDVSTDQREAARVAAENVPGVRSVEEHIVPAPLLPAF